MKNKILLYTFLFLLPSFSFSQEGFIAFLDSISTNNQQLISAGQLAEADKKQAFTGIYLANPTASYDRLSSPIGNYSEMLLTQSFDYPTTYARKKDIAHLSASQTEATLGQTKLAIFSNAASVYAALVGANRKMKILEQREAMLAKLEQVSKIRLDAGEATIFEANRVRSEVARAKSERQLLETLRQSLLLTVAELNGGGGYEISDTLLPMSLQVAASDTFWSGIMDRHPQQRFWEDEVQLATQQISLQKALNLPKFEAGYRQDTNLGQLYFGFHAGVSIPLFENKNTVEAARARQLYVTEEARAQELSLQKNLQQLVAALDATRQSAEELQALFSTLNTLALLEKAYSAGQTSYTEFFTEYDHYWQTALYIEELNQKAAALQLQLFVWSGI